MDAKTIKAWLKSSHHSQAWLSEQVGVHINTVNSWLTERAAISPPCQKLIALLMKEDSPQASPESTYNPLTKEELTTAADSVQRTPEGLIHGVLGFVNQSSVEEALNRPD